MPYYHIPGLTLWLVLLACFLVPAENRNRRTWLICIPIAAMLLIWGMLKQLLNTSGGEEVIFTHLVTTAAPATGMLLLLSGRLVSLRGIAVFFASLLILIVVGVISTWSFGAFGSSRDAMRILVIYAIWAVALLLAVTVTRMFTRKRLAGGRFGLILLASMVVMFNITMFLAFIVIFTIENELNNITRHWDEMLMVGAILGGISWLLLVPFLVLAFKSAFFRMRLAGCLGLSEPATEPAAGPDTPGSLS